MSQITSAAPLEGHRKNRKRQHNGGQRWRQFLKRRPHIPVARVLAAETCSSAGEGARGGSASHDSSGLRKGGVGDESFAAAVTGNARFGGRRRWSEPCVQERVKAIRQCTFTNAKCATSSQLIYSHVRGRTLGRGGGGGLSSPAVLTTTRILALRVLCPRRVCILSPSRVRPSPVTVHVCHKTSACRAGRGVRRASCFCGVLPRTTFCVRRIRIMRHLAAPLVAVCLRLLHTIVVSESPATLLRRCVARPARWRMSKGKRLAAARRRLVVLRTCVWGRPDGALRRDARALPAMDLSRAARCSVQGRSLGRHSSTHASVCIPPHCFYVSGGMAVPCCRCVLGRSCVRAAPAYLRPLLAVGAGRCAPHSGLRAAARRR